MTGKTLLSCRNISKHFKGVEALSSVDFDIHPGKIHGLVGENGAGKSTLMKIISGVYTPNAGTLTYRDRSIELRSPQEAIRNNIITIYQDSDLIPTLSVEENIFLNNEPVRGIFNLIRKRSVEQQTRELLESFNLSVDPKSILRDVPNDIQKMVQIIKGISKEATILLMDEPTSSLTKTEVEILLDFVRTLASQGVGIVFISHYLSEVLQVSDTITVLREGKVITTVQKNETSIDNIVTYMIGRNLKPEVRELTNIEKKPVVLTAEKLNVRNALNDVSLTLKEGEILGLTGIIGSGSSELAKVLFRSEDVKLASGNILLQGKEIPFKSTEESVKNGIAFLPNDRKNEGLILGFSVEDNICLPSLDSFRDRLSRLDKKAMKSHANTWIDSLHIKTPSSLTCVENLSGGNQQKVLLAKWLETEPKVLILDEPTIGIDVGTKYEIRKIIRNIADGGVGVLLITTELEELEKLCHRVIVLFRGEIIRELKGDEITKEAIIRASTGGER